MVRQGKNGSGIDGVIVSVLDPPIAGDYVIANPTGRGRRESGEVQRQLVSGVHDDVAVIYFAEERADISEARVIAGQVTPNLGGCEQMVVVRDFRRGDIGLLNYGISTVMEVGNRRSELCDFQRGMRQTLSPLDLVPVNFEVCAQAEAVRHAGVKDSSEIDEADFVSSGGEAQIWFYDTPVSMSVFDRKTERFWLLVMSLADGGVDGGVRGMEPTFGN